MTSGEQYSDISEIEWREAKIWDACLPGGLMNEVAQAGFAAPTELPANEVPNAIAPLRGPEHTRKDLIENAKPAIKEAAKARTSDVFELARDLSMRQEETFSEEQLARINPEPFAAVWIVEDGANKTGLVRPEVAEQAMARVYGEDAIHQELFHIGSNRPVPRKVLDKKASKVAGEDVYKDNPEYITAQELAPDFMPRDPKDDSLTSFDLSLAIARQRGYDIEDDAPANGALLPEGVARVVFLSKEDKPTRIMVLPTMRDRGLVNGLDAVAAVLRLSHEGPERQVVIATNGQYRPKCELQADTWAKAHNLPLQPPVALGDEAGFTVEHNGKPYVTADRAADLYTVEAAKLQRRYCDGI